MKGEMRGVRALGKYKVATWEQVGVLNVKK
jgi:hypothetical protein